MRLLDRYLLREFSLPWLYCLDAFALLWIVVDLFGTLDDFLERHTPFGQVVRYYLISLPDALVQIIPLSLLLGLLFCLSNLGRHNELLAMRAGGVSRARLALPLLLAGFAAALVVFVVNERFVPGARAQANSFRRALRSGRDPQIVHNLFYLDLRGHRDWYAARYLPATQTLIHPEIHERTPAGEPVCDIFAEQARWLNDQWVFFGVEVHHQRGGGQFTVERAAQTNFPAITDRPRELLLQTKRTEEMSSRDLRRIIRAHQRTGRTGHLAEYQTTLHHRYAFPWICLMVAWIGVPLGMSVRRSGALLSVGFALGLVVGYYFLNNIALALGGAGVIPPVVAAWSVNLLFAGLGAGLFIRLR